LLHLITEKKLAYASVNQAACSFRFLFGTVLGRETARFDIPMAKVPKRLPLVLSRDEVSRLFAHCKTLRERTLLETVYAAGLRLSEVCTLELSDIESAPDLMCIKVRQGKGGKDRYTLLSPRLLDSLRLYWRAFRPRRWVFPNRVGDGPIYDQTVQRLYGAVRDAARLPKGGGIHTLCHAFATHLLEASVDIHTIQGLLGHGHVSTTMRYFHLAQHPAGRHPFTARTAHAHLTGAGESGRPGRGAGDLRSGLSRLQVFGARGSPRLACDPGLPHGDPRRSRRNL
jgi:integrase/recombinase XerD